MPNCKNIGHDGGVDCMLFPDASGFGSVDYSGGDVLLWKIYEKVIWKLPFIDAGTITSPVEVLLDSTSLMTLTSHAWTIPDPSLTWACHDPSCSISVALSQNTTPITLI